MSKQPQTEEHKYYDWAVSSTLKDREIERYIIEQWYLDRDLGESISYEDKARVSVAIDRKLAYDRLKEERSA